MSELPIEIIGEIIAQLGTEDYADNQTLHTCLLVCKPFYRFAREAVFSNLHLAGDRDYEALEATSQMLNFCHKDSTLPPLINLIRSLTITINRTSFTQFPSNRQLLPFPVLTDFLHQLYQLSLSSTFAGLTSLRVNGSPRSAYWTQLWPPMCSAFFEICRSPTLRTLCLEALWHVPLPLITSVAHCRRLRVDYISCLTESTQSPPIPEVPPMGLETFEYRRSWFEVETSQMARDKTSDRPVQAIELNRALQLVTDLSRLKSLIVTETRHPQNRPKTNLSAILALAQNCLHLKLTYTPNDRIYTLPFDSISPSLTELEIESSAALEFVRESSEWDTEAWLREFDPAPFSHMWYPACLSEESLGNTRPPFHQITIDRPISIYQIGWKKAKLALRSESESEPPTLFWPAFARSVARLHADSTRLRLAIRHYVVVYQDEAHDQGIEDAELELRQEIQDVFREASEELGRTPVVVEMDISYSAQTQKRADLRIERNVKMMAGCREVPHDVSDGRGDPFPASMLGLPLGTLRLAPRLHHARPVILPRRTLFSTPLSRSFLRPTRFLRQDVTPTPSPAPTPVEPDVAFCNTVKKPGITKQMIFFVLGSGFIFFNAASRTEVVTDELTERMTAFTGMWSLRTITNNDLRKEHHRDLVQRLRAHLTSINNTIQNLPVLIRPWINVAVVSVLQPYVDASEGKRLCWKICLFNAAIWGLWKFKRLQPFMSSNFTHYPLSGRALTLLTSIFSHRSFLHLLFNCLALESFGSAAYFYLTKEQNKASPQILESTTSYHFLAFFVSAGIFSGLVSHIVNAKLRYPRLVAQLMSPSSTVARTETWAGAVAASSASTVAATTQAATKSVPQILPSLGASGAIYAAVTMTALAFPDSQIALFFPPSYPIDIQTGVGALVALDMIGIARGWRLFDHWAHLGGAAFGVWYYYFGPSAWLGWRVNTKAAMEEIKAEESGRQ